VITKIASKQKIKIDDLKVEIYENRNLMGSAAAYDVAAAIIEIIKRKQSVRMIFAAAPSQKEFLNELSKIKDVDWSKVTAFHMDEYVGLKPNSKQSFANYLNERIFNKVDFKKINFITAANNNFENICEDYSKLLSEEKIDIVCMGIGENGHIAFNDPPFAKFNDPKLVKVVELDDVSRQQQVNDGCFNSFEEVPKEAITLTIPALLSADQIYAIVPAPSKAKAVYSTLFGKISEECPASILRKHKNAKLYLDQDSSMNIDKNKLC